MNGFYKKPLLIVFFLLTVGLVGQAEAQALTARTLPVGFSLGGNVRSYGAVGDGVHDDTQAIQDALTAGRDGAQPVAYYYGRPKLVFLPAGTYLVSRPLVWVGCSLSLQGEGPGMTTIKLQDNAAGFGAGARQPLLRSPQGNEVFHQTTCCA